MDKILQFCDKLLGITLMLSLVILIWAGIIVLLIELNKKIENTQNAKKIAKKYIDPKRSLNE
jgi:type III secretory pathway component EscS